MTDYNKLYNIEHSGNQLAFTHYLNTLDYTKLKRWINVEEKTAEKLDEIFPGRLKQIDEDAEPEYNLCYLCVHNEHKHVISDRCNYCKRCSICDKHVYEHKALCNPTIRTDIYMIGYTYTVNIISEDNVEFKEGTYVSLRNERLKKIFDICKTSDKTLFEILIDLCFSKNTEKALALAKRRCLSSIMSSETFLRMLVLVKTDINKVPPKYAEFINKYKEFDRWLILFLVELVSDDNFIL